MGVAALRQEYHRRICKEILRESRTSERVSYPNIADVGSPGSIRIASKLVEHLGCAIRKGRIPGQTVGRLFEVATKDYLEGAFQLLQHLRPGHWQYSVDTAISEYDQYEHLAYLEQVILRDAKLAPALGGDYIITPDIVVGRSPVSDEEVNVQGDVINVSDSLARLTPLRSANRPEPRLILHASISCKWSIRSDRAQNTRTEALNLIRNRKGHLPHIAVVTAEPLPTRLAALALGTGDLDCVYHFALPELRASIEDVDDESQLDMLSVLLDGRRLRDISDLPFDLAV
jgi:hypothetical protein